MYEPWLPIDGQFLDMPQLGISTNGTSIRIDWRSTFGKGPSFSVSFDRGLAGLIVVDESVEASTSELLPKQDEFASDSAPRRPWFAWRQRNSPRKALYGDLGDLIYREVTSYYFSGGDLHISLDIADCEPRIELITSSATLNATE